MPRKRKVFTHPKSILIKFEEKEFFAIEAAVQAERQQRPHLARTELLREWILGHVLHEEHLISDKPIPCKYCGRLWPEHKLLEHEENCGKNPKWKGKGIPGAPSPVLDELVELRRWLTNKFTDIDLHFTGKVDLLEQFLFRGRSWADLTLIEQQKLLRFYLHPNVGSAPKQFRPVQFKEYLSRLAVQFDPAIIQGRQDVVAIFLQQQVGTLLVKNDLGFYSIIPSSPSR